MSETNQNNKKNEEDFLSEDNDFISEKAIEIDVTGQSNGINY